MKKVLTVVLSIVLLYLIVFIISIISVNKKYNDQDYIETINSATFWSKIYPTSDYMKIKVASASYKTDNYKQTQNYLNKINNQETAEYNTLSGHLLMKQGKVDEARDYYIVAYDLEPSIMTLEHLVNATSNNVKLVDLLETVDFEGLNSAGTEADFEQLKLSIYSKYFETDDIEFLKLIVSDNSEFKLESLTENKYVENYNEFLKTFNSTFNYPENITNDEKSKLLKEWQQKVCKDALDILNEYDLPNEATYYYLLDIRQGKKPQASEPLNFEIVNKEIVFQYNILENYEMAQSLIEETRNYSTTENQMDILKGYLIIINYFLDANKEKALNQTAEIKNIDIQEALIIEINKIEVYMYYQTHTPKETAAYFEMEVSDVLEILNEFKEVDKKLVWENK